MKTIVVATDFSPVASNAADYAAEMALIIHANLLLLHVYQVPVVYLEVPLAMNETALLKDAENHIIQLKERLALKTGNKLKIDTLIEVGVFFQELDAVCEQVKPYAVVIGSQGTTAAERLFLGEHAVYAMKHLMWPLITVSPYTKFSAVKKIGLACDFDKVADTIPVDELITLVNDFHAELYILNTGKEKVYNPEIVFEAGVLRDMLKETKPQYHFISSDDADEGILDFAVNNKIDLLIVLPKRYALFDSLIHRSLTKQLVLHSHVPVMALHH